MPIGIKDLKLKPDSPDLGAAGGRLSDSVYEALVAGILAGKLAPGAVLSELALGRQFKVSRTPIHDALVQLAKDGLVEQEANRRAVVAAFTSADVFDIFEMRKLLEGESARKAATKLDRIALAKLREAAEQMAASAAKPGAVARWVDFDEIFHTTIAEASGSKRLMEDITRYRMLHRSFNRMRTTPEVVQQALAEHMRILEALEKRDAKRASAEMVAHIHEWQAYFVNSFGR
ncbi:MAG: GntR family transcriptional regulator [Planctomycetota bacterium]